MNLKKHIPNTITCFNLFSGCVACVMAFKGNYPAAAIFIYMAAIFDFLDGFAARMLHAYSPMGKELDSLADCISFGMAPGLIMFSLLREACFPAFLDPIESYIPYFAFLIPIFSALRLAKFNIDERQASSFIGLPTPANTIFIASFASSLPLFFYNHGVVLLLIIVLCCYLLVSELPMFSLKIKSLKWKDNAVQYIFLALSLAILIVGGGLRSLYFIIILYIVMSAIIAFICKNKSILDLKD